MENISWYPGHMEKTKKDISRELKKVDVAVEIVDARIVRSSRNHDIIGMLDRKKSIKRVIVITKADLADEKETKKWFRYLEDYYTKMGINISVFEVNANNRKDISSLKTHLENYKQGVSKVKVMIFGIPNVGKSTIINRMIGKNTQKTENRPGITREVSWLNISDIAVLDTPGMLPKSVKDKEQATNLAIVGTIDEKHYDYLEIACELIKNILSEEKYMVMLLNRYSLTLDDIQDAKKSISMYYDIVLKIAKAKNMYTSGGALDENRAAKTIITDFRSGKIGRITLERI